MSLIKCVQQAFAIGHHLVCASDTSITKALLSDFLLITSNRCEVCLVEVLLSRAPRLLIEGDVRETEQALQLHLHGF